MKLFGKTWKYINEGNVHIVLELLGTDYVLRIIKEDDRPTELETIQSSVEFVNKIMSPLLVQEYRQEMVKIHEKELFYLSRNLIQFRPENRRHKSTLSPYAIKAPNLSIVSSKCELNFCVEIKPKEGFVSKSLSKYNKCYFCLKQYLKLESKEVTSISKYCPLDLFSGDNKRMKHALRCLIETPQNNFKLFENGILLYGEQSDEHTLEEIVKNKIHIESVDMFFDFITDILSKDSSGLNKYKEIQLPSKSPKTGCTEYNELNKNTVLYRLLTLQSLAENIDIHVANMDCKNFEYVPQILQQIKKGKLNLNLNKDRAEFLKTTDPIHLALISAVAKDCSIMISFSPDLDETHSSIKIGDKLMSYKVSVTDLEPKSVKTLTKRLVTEKKIADAYEKYLDGREIECKIQPHTETRAKQLEAWEQLITDYMKTTKQSTIDIRETQNSPLFNNASINRKLSQEAILTILEDMAKTGRAAPVDKSKNVWEIYWHSLDEWGNMVYNWACNAGMNNSVCTLFELREGENTIDQEFHGLDMNVLIKALKTLELKGKCELMEFDDNQGVKFF